MNLGEKQELTAVKKVEFGMYLAENPEDETRVALPANRCRRDFVSEIKWKSFYTGIPKTA